MTKGNDLEKVKKVIEADVARLEKSLSTSSCPVGEFVAYGDVEEKTDLLKESLGDALFKRLDETADTLGTTPLDLAIKAINEYLNSLDQIKAHK